MSYPTLKLKPGKEGFVARKHPWIFSGAFKPTDEHVAYGALVRVTDSRDRFLALGHYANGSIRVRVLSYDDKTIDQQFWNDRLNKALQVRKTLGLVDDKTTNAFRLIHGEGDGLPGLIIDIYNQCAVIQAHSAGMEQSANQIATALEDLKDLSLTTIYYSPAHGQDSRFIKGDATSANVLENDHQFFVDWESGQKTGFFLDQRINRALLAQYSSDKEVLNCFSYSGGFSVYALKAGARLVHSVDSSAKAIGWADKNVALNNLPEDKHQGIAEDVMGYLKNCQEYDVVVLDPPAYAKHLSARHQAVQGYKRLNIAGLKKVKPGGLLFTFSCSQVVDRELFCNTIVAAAIESGRTIRVLHHLSQPPDHPVNIFHPEGSYLKGLVLHVE